MTEKRFLFDESEKTVIDGGATVFPLLLSPFAIGKGVDAGGMWSQTSEERVG